MGALRAARIVAAPLVLVVVACSGSSVAPSRPTPSLRPSIPSASPSIPAASPSSSPSAVEELEPSAVVELSGSAASWLAVAGGSLWVTHFEADVISRVDPRLSTEIDTIDVGPNAESVAEVDGRLWIGRYHDPVESGLTVVDPTTGEIDRQFRVPNLCCETASAAGSVWVVDPSGSLIEVDPATGQILGTTAVELEPLEGHIGLVGDDRALWISSDTTPLMRVDPATGEAVRELDVGGGIPMTMSDGLLWGASPDHVWAVDPSTDDVVVSFPLEDTIETFSLAVTADTIWVAARHPGYVGTVLRLDRDTHQVTGEGDVSLPARLMIAAGSVWVVDWNTNSLYRFEEASTGS